MNHAIPMTAEIFKNVDDLPPRTSEWTGVTDLLESARENVSKALSEMRPECRNGWAFAKCTNRSSTDSPCSSVCKALEDIGLAEWSLRSRNQFSDELKRIETSAMEQCRGDMEKGRSQAIQESLELLREHLGIDYVGIWLFKDGKNFPIHEKGSRLNASSQDFLDSQIADAVKMTGKTQYAHICPSDSDTGGVDAVFVFRDSFGEPTGCLLLDDYDFELRFNENQIADIVGIFYDRLHAIIREEEILFAKDQLKKAQEETESLHYDPLMGILTRRIGMEKFREGIERLERLGGKMSAILLDVDHFKRVNDTKGHATGDLVLAGIGRALKHGFHNGSISYFPRKLDRFFRYGWEEVVAILEDTDDAGAEVAAEKIRTALSYLRFPDPNGGEFGITVTLGIRAITVQDLSSSGDADPVAYFLKDADQALYEGKRSGRNRTVVYGKPVQA